MNIGIIGAGYVGLTTGICLASGNHKISIFDTDVDKLWKINEKELPFFENGLQEMLENVIASEAIKQMSYLNIPMRLNRSTKRIGSCLIPRYAFDSSACYIFVAKSFENS